MKRILNIITYIFLFAFISSAQQDNFTNYTISDGLSQSVVNCVFQDSRGYIWFGTQNGLNRFDGESFEVFSHHPADTNSISNNWIYAISEDNNGDLWIGTKGGINHYLSKQNKFNRIRYSTGFTHDLTLFSYDNICLKHGKILINTPPLISFFDPSKNDFAHFRNDLSYDGSVKDVKIPLAEDKDGSIWIGSSNGLTSFSTDTKAFSYYSFLNQKGDTIVNIDISAIFRDRNLKLWIGTSAGLYRYNPEFNHFEESRFMLESGEFFTFENIYIRTITEDKHGKLFIGTEGKGLYVLSPNQNATYSLQNYTSANSAISHNIVQSLLIDRSENLWIGTLNGISKTDLKKKKFSLYRKSDSPNSVDLLGNVIASLYKDEKDIIWAGNWGQGLNLINPNTNTVEHFSSQHSGNHYIQNDFIHVIFKDKDQRIWLGTRDGILIYDKPGNQFIPWQNYFNDYSLPRFEHVRINMIIQDRSSNIWIGTHNGLYKVNLENSTLETFQKELDTDHRVSANSIYCLLEDSEGLIWIATVNGLDVYHPETKKIRHFNKAKNGLSDDLIISLSEDKHGKIWIGTSTYVNVYNKKDSTFSFYAQDHGLPNNNIFEILKDKNKDLWLATGKGLCKFDEKQNSFHTFTLEDGLQSLEFNLRTSHLCDDGEVLMGGMNGFNSFYPDSIAHNPYIPNVVFTAFYKTSGTSKEYVNLNNISEVILKPNVSSFTIEFAALEYTNPKKNKYVYQMEGISDEWITIGNRKFVPFQGLRPGDYTFKVKGSNNDGHWNNDEISVSITILPPWWRSIYAYISYLVLLIVSIFAFISIRERKLKLDKKILEEKVQTRTLQIEKQNRLIVSKNEELKELNHTKDKLFSIIGHDLGNQFNIILGFLEVLVSDFKKLESGKVEDHLHNINNSSKQAYALLENLLTWAKMQTKSIQFNPVEFDVYAKTIESLESLEGASSKKNIKIEVITDDDIILYADANMFSTMIRNLVYNAIKFTHKNGKIILFIKRKENICEITVKDNGVGIPEENIGKIFRVNSNLSTKGTNGEKGTGLGLIVVKEFIEKHKGEISVKSNAGKGCEFRFTLPLK